MSIEVVDLLKLFHDDPRRHVLFNTKRMHTWLHVYPEPGDMDDLHCHNNDQTWYLIQGECTIHFEGGGFQVMHPGTVAMITGGSFYQLENTGTGPMVLMGNRTGASDGSNVHINYETRKDIGRTADGGRPLAINRPGRTPK